MSILFFDTETTGFAKDKVPLDHPSQPHLLQLAAWLDDDGGNVRGAVNLLIAVGDIIIPDGAFAVHGISNQVANDFGVSPLTTLGIFHGLVSRADTIVAHNIDFDMKIMKIAYTRLDKLARFTADIQSKPQFCTKVAATDLCKLPSPYGRGGYKWPTLDEAYRILVNAEGFSGAHDAMNDVMACRSLYYSLKQPAGGAPPA